MDEKINDATKKLKKNNSKQKTIINIEKLIESQNNSIKALIQLFN